MPDASPIRLPAKNHSTVHAIVSAWRRLTGGRSVRDADRRTLVACSGGADSSALVLALAHYPGSVVVGHVVHDMRPGAESAVCLGAAERLAKAALVPFTSVHIAAKPLGGNYEAEARKLRYGALAKLALKHGCRFVATGHHAEDQLETVLMRLLRGAGPRGLAGIRARRKLTGGGAGEVTLVRPMLGIGREEARALCRESGWEWSEDVTNADLSRKRAALRVQVLPVLANIEPGAAIKAVEAARLAALTAEHLERARMELNAAAALAEHSGGFDRDVLRGADKIVLFTWLRALDARASLRALNAAANAIVSQSGEERQIMLGSRKVMVLSDRVSVHPLG